MKKEEIIEIYTLLCRFRNKKQQKSIKEDILVLIA